MADGTCSKCGESRDRVGRYCRRCHAAYMREWRKTHPLNEQQRRRGNARSYANVYLHRGKIERSGCEVCGKKAEMHHEDYDKPLEVTWLCRAHHMALHAGAT